MTQNKAKSALIKKVIEIELEMFRLVNSTIYQPSQDRIDNFCLMRRMHHSIWPLSILDSYLEDLTQAKMVGRNFIAEKFACLEKRIPITKESHQVDEIVSTEIFWMAEIAPRYPTLLSPLDPAVGEYIRCEYAVLSNTTITKISDYIAKAKNKGINLVEERYKNLCHAMGYESMSAMENVAQVEECA